MNSIQEKRKFKRIGYDMPFNYSLSVLEFGQLKKVNTSGVGIDMSEEGIGFFTDFPLEPGHIIRIRKGDDSYQTAMVRWVGKIADRFRVGVLLYK